MFCDLGNNAVAKHFVPYEEKKSPSEINGFFVMMANYTEEEIQNEHDTALEKEIQSWVDAKDCAKEALDQNVGSAIEKGGESVIHHLESIYHGGKALKMELENRFERENDSNDQSSSSSCEPGLYEDRHNRD